MKSHDVPADLLELLGRAELNGNDLRDTLAEILTRHREMVIAECNNALTQLQGLRRSDWAVHEATIHLLCAYRDLFIEYGVQTWLEDHDADGAVERIEELERRLDKLTCQCCVFGNHTELCTCDGEGCCHPDQYAEYLPVRRHGNWGEA